jgi:hypothetical protein
MQATYTSRSVPWTESERWILSGWSSASTCSVCSACSASTASGNVRLMELRTRIGSKEAGRQ